MNEPAEIELAILPVRRQRVMLSSDLVALYGVPAKALIQAVRRNSKSVRRCRSISKSCALARLRRILGEEREELSRRLDELERRYDKAFRSVFEAIRQLMAAQDSTARNPIGFTVKFSNEDNTP